MRLLLTDSGVTNASIMAALAELLGGPLSSRRCTTRSMWG